MSVPKRYATILFLLLSLTALPGIGDAGRQQTKWGPPLPVRLMLNRIQPLVQKKAYNQAVDLLLAFQARGGALSSSGDEDPRGYHHPEIYFALGNCYFFQAHYEQAAIAYGQTVVRDAAHGHAWLNLANTHYAMERYGEAGRCFGKAYAVSEMKNPEYLYYSATAYLMSGDYHRSIAIFEKTFATHPEAVQPQWKEHLVHALLAADQPRRALPVIRELVRSYMGEKQVQWQEMLLHQYLRLDMQNEALALARTLADRSPTVAAWWKALTHIHLNAGSTDKALAAFTIFAFLSPLSPEEKKLLADLNLQSGIPVKAVPVYEACLRETKDKKHLLPLITAYRRLGQCETALQRLDAFDPDTQDEQLLLTRAELLYTLKKFDQAASAYRRAARRSGSHAGWAWLMAGYAAWQTNDFSTSRGDFLHAAEFKQEKRRALAALKGLDTNLAAINDK